MESIHRFPRWAVYGLGCAILCGYLIVVVSVLVGGYESARRGGPPVFTDFTPKYAASLLVQSEPAANLYVPERMFQAEISAAQAAYGGALTDRQARSIGFAPWMYPPVFIVALYPLALLPYFVSLAAWLLATAVPYVLAVSDAVRHRAAWLLALAAPPAFYNIMYGQTGFLSAGLIGLGLSRLHSQPVLAGVCIGLASFKPHLGLLLPFALVAGGHWKPFGIATITVVGMVSLSLFAFGMDPWYGLIGTTELTLQGFQGGAYALSAMTSVLGMLQLAGVDFATAWTIQIGVGLAALAAVVWAWRNASAAPTHLGLPIAVLCAATLLSVPMAYCYDLALLVPAMAWIGADMKQRGAGIGQVAVFALATVAILPLKPIADATHIQYAPLLSLAFLLIALSRLHALRRDST